MANIPEYMRVRQYVLDLVMAHPDTDERIASERELCKILDVSRITARRALKALIDDGMLYVKTGKGMFINGGKWRNHAFTIRKFYKIMLIFGEGKMVYLDGFFMDVMEHICSAFKHLPVLLQPLNLVSESDKTIEELSMYRPDAIIWIRPSSSMMNAIEFMRRTIPVCVVGNKPDSDLFAASVDYRKAGRIAAAWFLDKGLKDLAIAGSDWNTGIKNEIYEGWKDELKSRNIPARSCLRIDKEGFSEEMEKLSPELDGIFTFGSDFPALDSVLAKQKSKCRIMVDENYYGAYGSIRKPDAKLIIFPPELLTQAAMALFRTLSDPSCKPESILIAPSVKEEFSL